MTANSSTGAKTDLSSFRIVRNVLLVRSSTSIIPVCLHSYFVYHQIMDVKRSIDEGASKIAAAIGDPGRARMLYALMDDRARTATELAIVAGISTSTASAHLNRLREESLVKMVQQGKHRYYTLYSADVADVLESLLVLSGAPGLSFKANTPHVLCAARRCYDHIAGALAVTLLSQFIKLGWLSQSASPEDESHVVTPLGVKMFAIIGIDVEAERLKRRRFAPYCLDWSERRPHLGGALGAAFLTMALKKKWLSSELDSRALSVTSKGKRELKQYLDLDWPQIRLENGSQNS
jgi:DNA-binding transcriptional ArsR family regulator